MLAPSKVFMLMIMTELRVSVKSKQKNPSKTADGGTKDVEIIVPLNNIWRTLEMPLIICEIISILIQSEKCVLSSYTRATTFATIDTKLYVPVLTISTQDNAKLLQQLNSGFKGPINWSKYQTKLSTQVPNSY